MPIKSVLKPEIKAWFEKSAASELYADFLYQYIANQFQRLGLFGAQKYYLKESEDEMKHYNMLVGIVNDFGDVLGVPAVEEITDKIQNFDDALEISYEIELSLMKQYQQFYEEAEDKYGDCVTAVALIPFLNIQRESIGEYGDLIARYELNKTDVFEFDEYMEDLAG